MRYEKFTTDENKKDANGINWRKGFEFAVKWSSGYTCHRTIEAALEKSKEIKNYASKYGKSPYHKIVSRDGKLIYTMYSFQMKS